MGLVVLLSWMFTSKFIKLLGHYIRYPVDFFLLPISIIFGYLHGLIKAKAMLSLNVVSLQIPLVPLSGFSTSNSSLIGPATLDLFSD